MKTVEGVYREGQIRLSEVPEDITEARVLVTFLTPWSADPVDPSAAITFGMFRGKQTTDDADFRLAEWRGGDIPDAD